MAIENSLVSADMIEATEYPELATRYQVYGVPLTVANDKVRLEGGAPEPYFVPRILEQLGITLPEPEKQEESESA